MRCEGCDGKFGANGEPEVEVDNADCAETTLSADVTVNIPCANCGYEFKTGCLSVEAEIADPNEHLAACEESDDRYFELIDADASVSEDYRPKTKRLKSGKEVPVSSRFQRHYYDVEVVFNVRCSSCGTDFEVAGSDSLGASELEAA